MSKPMNVVLGTVQAHLVQPGPKPLQELVLHQGGEGTSVVRNDKNVVCRCGDGATEDVETFQGLDWAVHRAWSGRQRDLVYSLLTLDGLGQGDGDDDALVDLPDLAPREVAHSVSSGRVAREQIAATQHREKQEQGRVLEHLESDSCRQEA